MEDSYIHDSDIKKTENSSNFNCLKQFRAKHLIEIRNLVLEEIIYYFIF